MSELAVGEESTPLASGYEAYNFLLGSQNMAHPARQGFSEGEYAAAITDPLATSTEMTINGETLQVPQLVPLSDIKWLNEDFYAKKFPEAHAADSIYCFNNSLGVEVGAEVQAGLKDLAEKQGVVVFDYPTSDADYLSKLQTVLSGLGINAGEVQELGTQAYFAGKVQLKRPHANREKPEGMVVTFNEMVADGRYDPSRFTTGASLHTKVPLDLTKRMEEAYEAAFEVLNNHPCKQGLSPEEFTDMAANDDGVVKLLYCDEGQIESLCILGEDLTKFDWINPAFFARAFPSETANNQVVYFPAIATDPEKQGGRNSEALIGLIAELCEAGDNSMIVAFDCCDINQGFLDVFLQEMINATPEASIEFTEIDKQRYCAVQLSK